MATAGDQYEIRTGNIWNFAHRDDIKTVKKLVGNFTKAASATPTETEQVVQEVQDVRIDNMAASGSGGKQDYDGVYEEPEVDLTPQDVKIDRDDGADDGIHDDGIPCVVVEREDDEQIVEDDAPAQHGPEEPKATTLADEKQGVAESSPYGGATAACKNLSNTASRKGTSGQHFDMHISPTLQNKVGWTPLHAAAHGGATRVLSFLLFACRVEVDSPVCNAGRSALMDAARTGQFQAAKMLLKAKADPSLQDKQGRTALQHALKNRALRDLLADKMTQRNPGPTRPLKEMKNSNAASTSPSGDKKVFSPCSREKAKQGFSCEGTAVGGGDDGDQGKRVNQNKKNPPLRGRKKKFGRNVQSSDDDDVA
ncbi:unnamed protein product [Amoebophrya sp. A25]|nr:unnamed protein product [Amoebophrya sp. A25]|eukprot:GSA25T00015206001.1